MTFYSDFVFCAFLFTVLGVFARKLIQQRTQFGPFIAPRVPKLEIVPPDNKLIFKVVFLCKIRKTINLPRVLLTNCVSELVYTFKLRPLMIGWFAGKKAMWMSIKKLWIKVCFCS